MSTSGRWEQRLERLESQNRRLRQINAGALVAVALVVGAGMAADDKKPEAKSEPRAEVDKPVDVISARRLEVVNAAGDVVWFAESSEHGGRSMLLDEKKTVAFAAEANEGGGGSIVVCKTNGKAGWQVMGAEKEAGMIHFNQQQQPVLMTIAGDFGGTLAVMNNQQKLACRLSVGEEKGDGGEIQVFNAEGKGVVQLATNKSGGWLELNNPQLKPGFVAWGDADGGGFGVGGKDGNPVISGTCDKGNGFLSVMSAEEKKAVSLFTDENGGIVGTWRNNGEPAAIMLSDENGGAIGVMNEAGKQVLRLQTASDSDGGDLIIKDDDDKAVIRLSSAEYAGHGALVLSNSYGQPGFIAKAKSDGGEFVVLNDDGTIAAIRGCHNGFGGLIELANDSQKATVRIGTDELSHGSIHIHDNEGLEVGRLFSHNGKGGHLYLKDGHGQNYIQLWNDNGNGVVYSRGN